MKALSFSENQFVFWHALFFFGASSEEFLIVSLLLQKSSVSSAVRDFVSLRLWILLRRSSIHSCFYRTCNENYSQGEAVVRLHRLSGLPELNLDPWLAGWLSLLCSSLLYVRVYYVALPAA